jgi:phosphohistidine phosphatase
MADTHRLHLLRHAKSSWEDRSLRDHARPLAPRGRAAAAALGRHLAGRAVGFDLILCSTANRTRQTWAGLEAAGVSAAGGVRFVDAVYDATAAELLGLLRGVDDEAASLLLIGHNPGVGDLAVALAGDGEPRALERLYEKYPTGALAELTVAPPWRDLGPGRARLAAYVRPRDLPT